MNNRKTEKPKNQKTKNKLFRLLTAAIFIFTQLNPAWAGAVTHSLDADFAGSRLRISDTDTTTAPKLEAYYQESSADPYTVGLWHFDGNGNDSSGKSHTATAVNVVFNEIGMWGSNAAGFDANGDSLTVLDSDDWAFGTGDFSIDFWVKYNGISGDQGLYGHGPNNGFFIYTRSSDSTINVVIDAGATMLFSGTWAPAVNTWYHVALVRNGNNWSWWINGKQIASTINTSSVGNYGGSATFGSNTSGSNAFNGSLDEFRILKGRALTPEEIKAAASRRPYAVYTSPAIDAGASTTWDTLSWSESGVRTGDGETLADSTGLVAQWNFNETTGTVADNAQGNAALDGTLTNFASTASQDQTAGTGWTANNKRWGAGALMFDGSNDYVSVADNNAFTFSGDFSMEFWVKFNSLTSNQYIITHWNAAGVGNKSYRLGAEYNSGNFLWVLETSADGSTESRFTNNWTATSSLIGQWQHFVVTRSVNDLKMFVNGRQIGATQTMSTSLYNSVSAFELGVLNSNNSFFSGILDSARIYSRALSASEILSNYNSANLQLQTRTGNSATPDDGTWEAWKPATNETQILSMDSDAANWKTSQTLTFSYTGAEQTYIVPNGVNSLDVVLYGASGAAGAATGGLGGMATATISVTPGETLRINVGGAAANNTGGWNGGGNGGDGVTYTAAQGGGGGASDIRQGGSALASRIVVAGGGGGGGSYNTGGNNSYGGAGGGVAGGGGTGVNGAGGGAGTGANGGAGGVGGSGAGAGGVGTQSSGGVGGTANTGPAAGGGGGGGYWGGGGGGGGYGNGGGGGGGGGGGASYIIATATNTSTTNGIYSGNGKVLIHTPIFTNDSNIKMEGAGSTKLTIGAPQADASTVALWHFEETSGSGAYIKDSTANANNGTPSGTTVVDGIFGKARKFNGTSDYVSVPDSENWNFGSGNFSIDGWVKWNSDSSMFLVDQWNGSGQDFLYINYNADVARLVFDAYSGGSIMASYYLTPWRPVVGVWYHIAVARRGTNIYLYLNGVSQTMSVQTAIGSNIMPNMTQVLTIGGRRDGSGSLNGLIDEVRILKGRALSADEIAESYRMGANHRISRAITANDLSTSNILPFYIAADRLGAYLEAAIGESSAANYEADANTVLFLHADEIPGSTAIKDSSLSGKTITVNGDAKISGSGKIGNAMYFGGTGYLRLTDHPDFSYSADFSIDFWFKTNTDAIPIWHQGGSTGGLIITVGNSSGTLGITANKLGVWTHDGVSAINTSSGTSVNDNNWHHGSVVRSGSTIKLYVDGKQEVAITNSIALNQASDPDLGYYAAANSFFNGYIDEFRIMNGVALSAEQIRQIYEYGLRSHQITIDFAAKLDAANPISGSGDKSFTVDATAYGLSQKGANLYPGDKIIVRENVDGTEYIAQGTVSAVDPSTGAVTVASWDSGATFPASGFAANASVFKWQREYFDLTGSLPGQRDAVTNLTIRPTNGAEGRTIYLDDFRKSGDYLTAPASSTIESTANRYLQYRAIVTSSDPAVSPSLTSVTVNNSPLPVSYFAVTHNDYAALAGDVETITITAKDVNGNVVTTYAPATTVSITKTESASQAGSAALSKTSLSAADFSNGAATITLSDTEAENVEVIATDASDTAVNGTSLPVAFSPAVASKIVFTSSAQTLTANAASAAYTVAVRDQYNNLRSSDAIALDLASSSAGGKFDTTSGGAFNGTVTSITTSGGSGTFYYKDTTAGSPTLTVSKIGLTSATQNQTVNFGTVSPTVTPASYKAGALTNNTIAWTSSALPQNGKIELDFPVGYDLSGTLAVSGNTGSTLSVSGNTLTITLGTAIAANSPVSLEISGIKNPSLLGSTGTYALRAKDASGTQIDQGTASANTITAPTLTLLTPSASGITLTGGQSYDLTWSYNGEISNSLKLSYSTDGTNYSNTIVSGESNDGTYTWSVPFYPGDQTKVKIEDTFYQKLLETSQAQFQTGTFANAGVKENGNAAKVVLGSLATWNTPSPGTGDFAFPAFADLDNDGDKDLLVGGWSATVAYENTGTINAPAWTVKSAWAPQFYCDSSFAFADLDGDGDLDMLIGERGGNVYGYKNTGSVSNPIWTAESSWNITGPGMDAVPAIADLDGDGLKDLLVGTVDGFSYAFKNTGTSSAPAWTAQTSWNLPDLGTSVRPALADLDNDGDVDVLVRDNTSIIYGYENTGGINAPIWTAKTSWDYQPIGIYGFGGLSMADLDNDGDLDLMLGNKDGTCKGVRNVGSATAPLFYQWTAKSEWNLPDLGNSAMPVFGDIDNDGDLDVLIRTIDSGMIYGYENTGNINSPVWVAKAAWNCNAVSSPGFGSPALSDLDNDGDLDLLVGGHDGVCYGYKNTGSIANPAWTAEASWNTSDNGDYAFPYLTDLDNDGDRDLLVGGWNYAVAYKNTGSVSAPIWTLEASWNPPYLGYDATYALADLDNDGDLDLLIGLRGSVASGGNVYGYKNTGSINNPVWTIEASWNLGVGVDASPKLADLDNDGIADLIVGVEDGICYAYKGRLLFYPSSGIFTSAVLDTGGNSEYGKLTWGATVPSQSGADTVKFQLSASADNVTWGDFVGPDGTANTYFTTSGTDIPTSFDTKRYIKYKAYLSTADASYTPSLNDVSITFTDNNAADSVISDVSDNPFTITVGGALSNTSVVPASTYAGAVGNGTVSFTTAHAIPADGKVLITFPAGWTLNSGASTTATSSTMDGTLAVSTLGQTLTLTRSAGSQQTAGAESITLTNIKNPSPGGSSGTFAIQTTTSSGPTTGLIDQDLAVAAKHIIGTLTSPAVSQVSYKAGAASDTTISFTTISAIPAGGKVEVDFPVGYDLSGSLAYVSGNSVTTVSASGNTLTLTLGAQIAASTAASIVVSGIKSPQLLGSTGTYSLRTKDSAGALIDEGTASANTLVAPVLSLLTPSAAAIKLYAGQPYDITWSYDGGTSDNIKLSYSTNGGSSYLKSIAQGEANDNAYTWTVPYDTGTNMKVKVEETFYQKLLDTSDAQFGAGTFVDAQVYGSGGVANLGLSLTPGNVFTTGITPIDLTFDSSTNSIWVVNNGSNSIQKFRASDGMLLGGYTTNSSPSAITFDSFTNSIWVTCAGWNNNLQKFRASDGVLLGTYTISGLYVDNGTEIVFDSSTNSVWATGYPDALCKVNVSDGATVGSYGFNTNQGVRKIVFDPSANSIWVAHPGSGLKKIQVSDGALLGSYSTDGVPGLIAFDSSANAILVTNNTDKIQKFRSSDGALLATFPYYYSSNNNLAFDSHTNSVWVLRGNPFGVYKLSSVDGTLLGTYASGGESCCRPDNIIFEPSTNSIWVTNYDYNTVRKIRVADGSNPVSSGTYAVPSSGGNRGVTFDTSTNSVWALSRDGGYPEFQKFRASDGTLLFSGAPNNAWSGPGNLMFESYTNSVWATLDNDNTVVWKIRASDGVFIGSYGGSSGGGCCEVNGLAFDASTNSVWVTNYNYNTVRKINALDGTLLGTYTTNTNPIGVVFDSYTNSVWVSNYGSNTLQKFRASDGILLGTYLTGTNPRGVIFDSSTNSIWVANYGSKSIQKFRASDGQLLGTYTTGAGPYGIAFENVTNSVWVTCYDSNLLQKFRASDGELLTTYSPGLNPTAVVFDSFTNSVWVTNYGSNTVQKIPVAFYLTSGSFTSRTLDTGGNLGYGALSWSADVPSQVGANAIKFHVSASVDNNTWTDFMGPDGTANSYFNAQSPSGTATISGPLINGQRYIKYKAYLSTTDQFYAPTLNDVSITFSDSNSADRLISDVSDNTFEITRPEVTITAPGNAESDPNFRWIAGRSYEIKWQTRGKTSESWTIEGQWLDDLAGLHTTAILDTPTTIASSSFDGIYYHYSYTWTISDTHTLTNSAYVRITAYGTDANNAAVTDTADSTPYFKIVASPQIALTEPISGQEWFINSANTIKWTMTEPAGDTNNKTVTLQYAVDSPNFANWVTITSAGVNNENSQNSFSWTIDKASGLPAGAVKLKVFDNAMASTTDTTSWTFKISNPAITIAAPLSGQVWRIGAAPEIQWSTTAGVSSEVKIEYFDGTNWNTVMESEGTANDGVVANDGKFVWTVPNIATLTTAKIRITDAQAGSATYYQALSESQPFEIAKPLFTITLPTQSPLRRGGSYTFSWSDDGTMGTNLDVLYAPTGTSFSSIKTQGSFSQDKKSFTWSLPVNAAVPQTNAKFQVKDNSSPFGEGTSTVFSVDKQRLTFDDSTVSGASWPVGSQHTIGWSTEGEVTGVYIYYYKGTSNIATIDQSANNNALPTGYTSYTNYPKTYSWTIANDDNYLSSGNAKVKISAKTPLDAAVTSTSAAFTVREPYLTVSLPSIVQNSGKWVQGDSLSVSWSGDGTVSPNGQLELAYAALSSQSDNLNTAAWVPFATLNISGAAVNSGSFDFRPIDYSIPAGYLALQVRDININRPLSKGRSAVFEVSTEPYIGILAPLNTPAWRGDTDQVIQWQGAGSVSSALKIEYSTDNSTWYLCKDSANVSAENLAASGSFNWRVPEAIKDSTAYIRVVDTQRQVTQMNPTGITVAVKGISLTDYPGKTTGESFTVGDTKTITWSPAVAVSDQALVKIEYSTDSGHNTWGPVSESEGTANDGIVSDDGSFDWVIPDVISGTAKIRVGSVSGNISAASANDFKIIGSLEVSAPAASANWIIGTTQTVSWNTLKGTFANVKLQYSPDNGANWKSMAGVSNAATVVANNGTYSWTIPDDYSATAKVRIYEENGLSNTAESSLFTIASPQISISQPSSSNNGNSALTINEPYDLKWTTTGSTGTNNLKIEISYDNQANWSLLEADWPNTSPKSITPTSTSVQAWVKISEKSTTHPGAVATAGPFTVLPTPQITLSSPALNSAWTMGKQYEVKWDTQGLVFNTLRISYTLDASVGSPIWVDVVSGQSNTKSFYWTLPDLTSTLSSQANAKLRITDDTKGTVGYSDIFTISIPSMSVVRPQGGEVWAVGDAAPLKWSYNGAVIGPLALQYDASGVLSDASPSITASAPKTGQTSGTYTYSWTVPSGAQTSNVKARVKDSQRPNSYADSPAGFEVIAAPTIEVTSPVDGDVFVIQDSMTVNWKVRGLSADSLSIEYWDDVDLDNVKDADETLYTLASGVSRGSSDTSDEYSGKYTGTKTITLPDNAQVSANLKLRLRDPARGYEGLAAGHFRIRGGFEFRDEANTANALASSSEWKANTSHAIKWYNKGSFANVKLEYATSSNGTSWGAYQEIISTLANSPGNNNISSYSWGVPDPHLASYPDEPPQFYYVKLKITNLADTSVFTESAAFKIGYYTVTWKIKDYDTLTLLDSLTVSSTYAGTTYWRVNNGALTSASDARYSAKTYPRRYPYGVFSTFWSKDGYGERSDNDRTINADTEVTVLLESAASAQTEYKVYAGFAYNEDTDKLKINSWLEKKGTLITSADADVGVGGDGYVKIYDGESLKATLTDSTVDSNGNYWFESSNVVKAVSEGGLGLESGKTYFARMGIWYRSREYQSGAAFEVTISKSLKAVTDEIKTMSSDIKSNVSTIGSTVAAEAAATRSELKTSLDAGTAAVKEKLASEVSDLKSQTSKILTAAETTIPEKINTDLAAAIKSDVKPHIKSGILNRDNVVKTGQSLTIRYRTETGKSPTVNIYNPKNAAMVSGAAMTEVSGTGIYEYTATFSGSWGVGDFSVVCSESSLGTVDAMVITVIKHTLDEVAGMTSSVMGSTSSLSDFKGMGASLVNIDAQFKALEQSLSGIGQNIVSKVQETKGVVSEMESVYNQLANLSAQIKSIGATKNVNLEKLYEVSQEKKEDIVYLKNKAEELKAVMELNKKMTENVAKKPVVQSWFEYR